MCCDKLIICGCCKQESSNGQEDMDDTEDALLQSVLQNTMKEASLWDALDLPEIQQLLKAAEDDSDMFPTQTQINSKAGRQR